MQHTQCCKKTVNSVSYNIVYNIWYNYVSVVSWTVLLPIYIPQATAGINGEIGLLATCSVSQYAVMCKHNN